jgi:hypothetical protein
MESVQQALSAFCEAYWPPLYAFLRHRRSSSTDAQDLVQAFFAHLLAQNTLSHADQAKGRLRTFLLGSLQNFLFNRVFPISGSSRAVRLRALSLSRVVICGKRMLRIGRSFIPSSLRK